MQKDPIVVFERNSKEDNQPISFEITVPENNFEDVKDFCDKGRKGAFFKFLKEITYESKDKRVWKRITLETMDYVGVFVFPDNPPIIIKSKISNADIFQMLKYIDVENLNIFDEIVSGFNEDKSFLELIIDKFLNILEEFFRYPIQKNYNYIEESRSSVKGKILISETIKSRSFLFGKVHCRYNHLNQNTFFNQIIKYTLHLIQYIAKEKHNHQIRNFSLRLTNITLIPITDKDLTNLQYNRFTSNYRKIHSYCRLIIKKFAFSQETGDFICHSLMFNSNSIFEQFLCNLMKELFENDGYLVEKYSAKGFQPDIVIRKQNQIRLICDAKYKYALQKNDLGQMSTYLLKLRKKHRHNEESFPLEFRNAILIYPTTNSDLKPKIQTIEQYYDVGKISISFINLNKILNDEKYLHEWKEKLIPYLEGKVH